MPTPQADRDRFCLSDDEVLALKDSACAIERHYRRPMDIEWAKDGTDGRLYTVQSRPETVGSRRTGNILDNYVLDGRAEILTEGRAVGGEDRHRPCPPGRHGSAVE